MDNPLCPEDVDALRRQLRPEDPARPAGLSGTIETTGRTTTSLTDRLALAADFLRAFVARTYPGNQAKADLLDRVLADAREAASVVDDGNLTPRAPLDRLQAAAEVVVHTDGSAPAFLLKDGAILFESSPDELWRGRLEAAAADLTPLFGSIGRIDIRHPNKSFAGTGWLVAPDLLMTNRHVVQEFVDFDSDDVPRIIAPRDPHVDFGHLFGSDAPVNRRPVTDLLFCGATPVPQFGIDHAALDVAVLRLGGAQGSTSAPLSLGLGSHLALPQTEMVVIGYPAALGDPEALGTVSETDRVMKLLFAGLWGLKRLAPGHLRPGPVADPVAGKRTLAHDASTLGGNSGSVIVGLGSLPLVTGLHYGGRWGGARTNWGHPLAAVLDEPGLAGLGPATLRDLAAAEGIALVPHSPF